MPNESIGSIAIAPSDPNVVYVGTGEANNRQSSSIGDGMWGTTDGGKTWTHLGLEKAQSINRVVVDPTNPKIVYVAAPGPSVRPQSGSRPVQNHRRRQDLEESKYIDPDTGFNDVAIDPSNPKILYASSFQRRRTWWGYNGGGPGSALWKSTDGGDTWTKLDGPGWPKPKDGIYGRIAISIFRANPKIDLRAGGSGRERRHRRRHHGRGRPAPPGGRGGGGGGGELRGRPAELRQPARQRRRRRRWSADAAPQPRPIPTAAASSAPKTAARPGPS